jgi:hypothetical protein
MGMHDLDQRVRLAAFKWLEEQVRIHGDVLPRSILSEGFEFENQRVPLVGPQGIFKPKLLSQIPLSITTAPQGPYEDSFGPKSQTTDEYSSSTACERSQNCHQSRFSLTFFRFLERTDNRRRLSFYPKIIILFGD